MQRYKPKNKAVFLDRDGTIIDDRGHLGDKSEVVFYPETFRALEKLSRDFLLFIVTNQPGVSRGIVSRDDVDCVNDYVVSMLNQAGIEITDVYVCPHTRDGNCDCIKPKPHFLQKAQRDYDIDLSQSFVLGDHPHDIHFAENVGARGIYLLTGHGSKHLDELSDDMVIAPGIAQAVEMIIDGKKNYEPLGINICEEVQKSAQIIANNGVVVFPTETVYGLGANVFSAAGVERVFHVKKRPQFNPLIVHIAGLEQIDELAQEFPADAKKLAELFWPGPLTIVLPKKPAVPDSVTAGLPTVAIRMPEHPIALALIRQANLPVAAPSANYFGQISPTSAEHIDRLSQSVDMVLQGGLCRVGLESTIISFAQPMPRILRFGSITLEQIEQTIGPVETDSGSDDKPLSPGRLPKHYSPSTPLIIWRKDEDIDWSKRIGLLSFNGNANDERFTAVETLSPSGDLEQAAAQLYAAMRRLDAQNLDVIFASQVPDIGIGKAINDRLKRAAGNL